jgi:hypothetical protein
LRDNPIAIAEGAVGAPRVEFAALSTWYATAGGIGTYCFAKSTADTAFGGSVAGSTLQPTSAATGTGGSTNGIGSMDVGTALSGTWRAMGTFDLIMPTSGLVNWYGATLWLRIA